MATPAERGASTAGAWAVVTRHLTEGRLDDAERALDAAHRLAPNSVGAALVRARIAWERGRQQDAVAILEAQIVREPNAPALQVAVAEMWRRMDRPELALAWASEAQKLGATPAIEALVQRIREDLAGAALGGAVVSEDDPWDPDPSYSAVDPTVPIRPIQREEATAVVVRKQVGRSSVDRQLEAMLGGSLFTQAQPMTAVRAQRRRRRDPLRLFGRAVLVMFAASFALGALGLVTVGVDRQERQRAAEQARDLSHLLAIGSLEAAMPLLEQVRFHAGESTAIADLAALADMLLYRYHDRLEGRLQRVAQLAPGAGAPSLDRLAARAVVALERGQLDEVAAAASKIRSLDPKGVHGWLLEALAQGGRGQHAEAEEAFAKLEELEPTHLPYLYERVDYWVGRGKLREASELADRMNDVSPKSPWTLLARARAGDASALVTLAELAPPPAILARAKTLEAGR